MDVRTDAKYNRYPQTPNFKALIVSREAKVLLKEGDELIKKTTGFFPSMYVQADMEKPLWSKIERVLTEQHAENPNNIIIDVVKQKSINVVKQKGKKLLKIVTTGNNGQIETSEIVEPFVKEGTWSELFGKSNYVHSSQNPDKKYVKSDFFDALANAEEKVNDLFANMKMALEELKISIRELPKESEPQKQTIKRSKKTLEAWERKQKKKEAWEAERLKRQEAGEKAQVTKKAGIKDSGKKTEATKKLSPLNKQRISRKDKKAQKTQNS